jgi:hypothetical protein
MGKLTKELLKKHLEHTCNKKKFKKKEKKFLKEVQGEVAMAAIEKLGDDELDSIVIDDVSIEITAVNSEIKASKKSKSMAAKRCFIYCYVINGRPRCREICY